MESPARQRRKRQDSQSRSGERVAARAGYGGSLRSGFRKKEGARPEGQGRGIAPKSDTTLDVNCEGPEGGGGGVRRGVAGSVGDAWSPTPFTSRQWTQGG